MIYIDNLDFPRAKELEVAHEKDDDKVPGYLLECTDGHTYLIFAQDMASAKHSPVYQKLFDMAKTRMSDHDHDSVRLCFRPAFSKYRDEYHDHKVFRAPASEIGKIYIVE